MPQAGNRKATVHRGLAVTIEVPLRAGFRPLLFLCTRELQEIQAQNITSHHLSSQDFSPASYTCAAWLNGGASASYGSNKSILLFPGLAFLSASSREAASDF